MGRFSGVIFSSFVLLLPTCARCVSWELPGARSLLVAPKIIGPLINVIERVIPEFPCSLSHLCFDLVFVCPNKKIISPIALCLCVQFLRQSTFLYDGGCEIDCYSFVPLLLGEKDCSLSLALVKRCRRCRSER